MIDKNEVQETFNQKVKIAEILHKAGKLDKKYDYLLIKGENMNTEENAVKQQESPVPPAQPVGQTQNVDANAIRQEMEPVITDLMNQGVNFNSTEETVVGLGDVVEATLTKFGITQERFKEWFNLQECNCTKRKKWLNNLFSWKRTKE